MKANKVCEPSWVSKYLVEFVNITIYMILLHLFMIIFRFILC